MFKRLEDAANTINHVSHQNRSYMKIDHDISVVINIEDIYQRVRGKMRGVTILNPPDQKASKFFLDKKEVKPDFPSSVNFPRLAAECMESYDELIKIVKLSWMDPEILLYIAKTTQSAEILKILAVNPGINVATIEHLFNLAGFDYSHRRLRELLAENPAVPASMLWKLYKTTGSVYQILYLYGGSVCPDNFLRKLRESLEINLSWGLVVE